MPKTTQVIRENRAANVIAGIRKHLPRNKKINVDGKAYTVNELVAPFQQQLDAIAAVRSARAALAVAVRKERAAAKKVNTLTRGLKPVAFDIFNFPLDVLADFGWQRPKKPGPKTTAAKLTGVLKAAATRKARGTMGRRQRLTIRGVIPTPTP
jgi:hypothetical protein